MSALTMFTSGKSALRKGAIALAAGSVLMAANAQAASFTQEECGLIAGVSATTVRSLGADNLSVEFRDSLMRFVAPDGRRATCDGHTEIKTRTADDAAAFATIRRLLLSPPHSVSLQRAGVRAVTAGTPLAFNR